MQSHLLIFGFGYTAQFLAKKCEKSIYESPERQEIAMPSVITTNFIANLFISLKQASQRGCDTL